MNKRALRLLIGIFIGFAALIGTIWLLSQTLGNMHFPELYAGKPLDYWHQQLYGRDVGASNNAFAVVSSQLIPRFVDAMFHDTNDSRIRLSLVETLNDLPGVTIHYAIANKRRAYAAMSLGALGPAAKSAVPDLIKALKGNDEFVREAAILSLGKIRSDAGTVIPLLIPYLEDEDLDIPAACTLAEFGSLAKPAVPKLLPLLSAKRRDARAAARYALLKIDPEAAAKAGIKVN